MGSHLRILILAAAAFAFGALMGFLGSYINVDNPVVARIANSLGAAITGASLSAAFLKGDAFLEWLAAGLNSSAPAVLIVLVPFIVVGFLSMYFSRTLFLNLAMIRADKEGKKIMSDEGLSTVIRTPPQIGMPAEVGNAARRLASGMDQRLYYEYETLLSRGVALKGEGRLDPALKELNQAKAINPNDHRVFAALAATHLALGQRGEASGNIEAATERLPQQPAAFWLKTYADILFEVERYKQSAEFYAKYLEIHETDARARFNHATALARWGAADPDYPADQAAEDAIQELRKAIELDSRLRQDAKVETASGGAFEKLRDDQRFVQAIKE